MFLPSINQTFPNVKNAYHFRAQENITNQKLKHNKHFTQKTIIHNSKTDS
jgi:hypothetical protein